MDLFTDGDLEGREFFAPHSYTLLRCSHHWYWSKYSVYALWSLFKHDIFFIQNIWTNIDNGHVCFITLCKSWTFLFLSLLQQTLFCIKTLVPGNPTCFPDDRRQSMSRQPSFTYSEWMDTKQDDFYELDAVPETPVFDCFMDIKTEADAVTLTVQSVGLQERWYNTLFFASL